tara:strand:- start:19 stop:744 length:726 start_codon:yes stop_codon:yes gene_type:complete
MKKIGIIGYGRFGKVLHNLLSDKFDVLVYDFNQKVIDGIEISAIEKVLDCSLVFVAVPISSFEECIKDISRFKLYNTTILDVCSVKVYPVEIMTKYLPEHIGIIGTHPHFGPDSYTPFRELKATVCAIRDSYNRMNEIKEIFKSLSIRVVEMSADKHDKLAASSQGITHFIGRVLNEAGIRSTEINTLGFNGLLGVIEQTCNDSWDLFKDLQKYNPYTREMIESLIDKINEIHNQIISDAN